MICATSCAKISSLKMQNFSLVVKAKLASCHHSHGKKSDLADLCIDCYYSTIFYTLALWNILLQSSNVSHSTLNYRWTFLKMSFSPTYLLSFPPLSLSFKFYYTSFSCFYCAPLSYPKLNFANRIRRWGCSSAQQCEIFSVCLEMHFFALEYKKA